MKTKYYVIQYNEGKGWKDLDSTEYTEQEIRERIPSNTATMKFRKKFIKEEETVFLSVSREPTNTSEPPMYGFNHEQLMEMVKVTCYNETTMYTRKAALIFFRRGMACSEGAEHERYEQIFLQLLDGETVCNDC